MSDTDLVRPYRRNNATTTTGPDRLYQQREHRAIETSIASILLVLELLEARVAALESP